MNLERLAERIRTVRGTDEVELEKISASDVALRALELAAGTRIDADVPPLIGVPIRRNERVDPGALRLHWSDGTTTRLELREER